MPTALREVAIGMEKPGVVEEPRWPPPRYWDGQQEGSAEERLHVGAIRAVLAARQSSSERTN
jgi:hypothetical protein